MANRDYIKSACRHCAGHIEFPAEAAGQTVVCPHCGQATELASDGSPNKTRSSRRLWLGIIGAVCLVAAGVLGALWLMQQAGKGGVSDESPTAVASSNANPQVASPNSSVAIPLATAFREQTNAFDILPFKLASTPGSSLVYVTGAVQNLSGRQRFGVKIVFGLYDTNGHAVGSAEDYQSVLDPHADWRFRALVIQSKTASARFNSISEAQ
jgi:hypothetical protein